MLATGSNFTFKIAAKPLQIDLCMVDSLLMTAYRNSLLAYPSVDLLSPTLYDVRFSYNTCATD